MFGLAKTIFREVNTGSALAWGAGIGLVIGAVVSGSSSNKNATEGTNDYSGYNNYQINTSAYA